jgi:imidazolonepropionase-like amidohydrolase
LMEVILRRDRSRCRELGKAESLGTLQPSRLADMVVVNRDPPRDLSWLRDIALPSRMARS